MQGVTDIEVLKRINETSTIAFRVPLYVKVMYRRLPPEAKEVVKEVLVGVITSGELVNVEQKVINLNVNINKNVVSQPRSDVDESITEEYIKVLKEDLRRAREIIRRKNEEIKRLKKLVDRVRAFARAGDLRSIRKVLGCG